MVVRNLMLCLALSFGAAALAEDTTPDRAPVEIEYLVSAVGDSGCDFIRNGTRHDAEAAESHLRMKYRRARRHATTAERFIERLASRSSMTRRPYRIVCPGDEPVPSSDWLAAKLAEFRKAAASQ